MWNCIYGTKNKTIMLWLINSIFFCLQFILQFFIGITSARCRVADFLDIHDGCHVNAIKYQLIDLQSTYALDLDVYAYHSIHFLVVATSSRYWMAAILDVKDDRHEKPINTNSRLSSHLGFQAECLSLHSMHPLIGATSSIYRMTAILDFKYDRHVETNKYQ